MSYYARNKPYVMSNGTYNATFEYGPNGNYWKQIATYSNGTETTKYLGGLLEIVQGPSVTSYRHHIKANGRTVAIYSRGSNGANNTIYPLNDHLGSTDAITTSSGAIIVKESFAAFGSRRNGSTWSGAPSGTDMTAIGDATRRGYTDHTMLDNIGLIHMNGKVMDPVIGKFVSADPMIDCALNTQGWNRYAYVKNNPLTKVDPTGYTEVVVRWRPAREQLEREDSRSDFEYSWSMLSPGGLTWGATASQIDADRSSDAAQSEDSHTDPQYDSDGMPVVEVHNSPGPTVLGGLVSLVERSVDYASCMASCIGDAGANLTSTSEHAPGPRGGLGVSISGSGLLPLPPTGDATSPNGNPPSGGATASVGVSILANPFAENFLDFLDSIQVVGQAHRGLLGGAGGYVSGGLSPGPAASAGPATSGSYQAGHTEFVVGPNSGTIDTNAGGISMSGAGRAMPFSVGVGGGYAVGNVSGVATAVSFPGLRDAAECPSKCAQ